MKAVFISVIIILFMALAMSMSYNFSYMDNPTAFAVKEVVVRNRTLEDIENEKLPEFKTYTKAVCEEGSNAIICKDELFVSCQGVEHKISEIKGEANFKKDWKDPRE